MWPPRALPSHRSQVKKDGAEDRGGNRAYANDLKDRCQRRLRQRRLRHAEKAAV